MGNGKQDGLDEMGGLMMMLMRSGIFVDFLERGGMHSTILHD